MLGLRKLAFYIFFGIYLVLCPLLIARLLGFVVNPLTHRLVKTGLVYVSTNPSGATIYVDGKQGDQTTPTAIRDLIPGQHFIRIELNDYNDWKGVVPVKGKKVTMLSNILLVPQVKMTGKGTQP